MLKIALVGYGKMGQAIEKEALSRGHQISFRIDKDDRHLFEELNPENTDVIIEFTHPASFFDNLQELMPRGIPLVTGTTGWYEDLEEVITIVEDYQGALLYASNFSIGVNILFKLNQQLAQLMNPYPDYDVYLEEQHHRHKADAPSGTAISLSKQILEGLDRKDTVAAGNLGNRAPSPHELSVGYVRAGEIIGKHKISYVSEIDSLEIVHQAHNRRGFALGAVIGAEKIIGKEGVINFSDWF